MCARPVRQVEQTPHAMWVSTATKAPCCDVVDLGTDRLHRPRHLVAERHRHAVTRPWAHSFQSKMWRSVPQMDAACTRTSTSPSPGSGTGTSLELGAGAR